jgi:hypothetical protein
MTAVRFIVTPSLINFIRQGYNYYVRRNKELSQGCSEVSGRDTD